MRETKAPLKNVQMKVQFSRIKNKNTLPPSLSTVFILLWLLLDEMINKQR